jgi:hypothetical protein
MREFIYRIWDIKQQKYVMIASLYGCEGMAHLTQCFNRNESVIEEYTGIHDCKGNRIFEGDIIKQKIGRRYEYYPVTWESGLGWYINEFPLCMFDDGLTVVGNVHQPLKKKK